MNALCFTLPLSLRPPTFFLRPRLTNPTRRMTNRPAAQLIQPAPSTGQGSESQGPVRVRQHVNPLARRWSQPLSLPSDWYTTAFTDSSLPLVVDLGVAKGRFLLKAAAQRPRCNFLGLEIREPLVHQANRAVADAGLSNLFYLACNANVSLEAILSDVPSGRLREVYIQFCDPWFKKRHAKRRMVNSPLVTQIFNALSASRRADSGCEEKEKNLLIVNEIGIERDTSERRVFVQSDVLEVAVQIRGLFDTHTGFERLGATHGFGVDGDDWLVDNPVGIATEREIAVRNKDGSVYRAIYRLAENE